MQVKLIGVLNVTPDSFSDGGDFLPIGKALDHAYRLIKEGAHCIEIGGESSRVGSVCIGPDQEWERVAPVIEALRGVIPLSIDTHHSSVACRAIDQGVEWVNDIGGAKDQELIEGVFDRKGKLMVMYSRSGVPHVFDQDESTLCKESLFQEIMSFASVTLGRLGWVGFSRDDVVFDPGMGRFLGADPNNSWHVLAHYDQLKVLGCDCLLAVSRKGFLGSSLSVFERDSLSAQVTSSVVQRLVRAGFNRTLWIRVHNVGLHQRVLRMVGQHKALPFFPLAM